MMGIVRVFFPAEGKKHTYEYSVTCPSFSCKIEHNVGQSVWRCMECTQF
ncbi:hypothetical protein B4144_3541 [Bacillus atrophaeus]|nr:hypothetical protein B4144_3541 [Bacillus atrophaeus]